MKSLKKGGLHKAVSFVLIAVVLVFVLDIAVNGWQELPDDTVQDQNSGNVDDGSNDADEDETKENQDKTDESIVVTPVYYHPFTGLEVSEEEANSKPIGFIFDSTTTTYGLSNAYLTVEIPTEDGKSRLLAYTNSTDTLWKVGALTSTRDSISEIAGYFGGVLVCYGDDTMIKLNKHPYTVLDLKEYSGSIYKENAQYIYTNSQLVNSALTSTDIQLNGYSLPYILSDGRVVGNAAANTVTLAYSDGYSVELTYSRQDDKYVYSQCTNDKIDMLSGDRVSYTNAFVLFTNTLTYETSSGTEMVLDTAAGGNGYYISGATVSEIIWSVDENGALVFNTLSYQPLEVNCGNSYIAFFKTSEFDKVCVY